jgi:hypothetical protein
MNGEIDNLIVSKVPTDVAQVQSVFGPNFRNIGAWRSFLRSTLNDNVTSQLSAPEMRWNEKSFQASFVACWMHHPVEKGSFMIDLSAVPPPQRSTIESAMKKHCSGRKSSHLSGSGRSATNDWEFLNGYKELLEGVLEFHGKQITAREMMKSLFQLTHFPAPPNLGAQSNRQVGTLLTQYCNAASIPGPAGAVRRAGDKITQPMIADLRELAQTLQKDGDVQMARVYREIRATPAEIDQSLTVFNSTPG